ncbi:unnamed protein product [Cuscuta campestris]|uniref:Uncharacterized protein n=1 Tax=Cuscuta campestris TaxID=132261 RepID=A0A484N7H6_9ASTE|nr:unnamed protein product [Cuscuta campestris]
MRDAIDPITLKDIDDCSEWFIGEECSEETIHDLTVGDISRASGAEEPIYYTRRVAPSGTTGTSSSTPQPQPQPRRATNIREVIHEEFEEVEEDDYGEETEFVGASNELDHLDDGGLDLTDEDYD